MAASEKKSGILGFVSFWLNNARFHSYKQSLIPALIAVLFVSERDHFSLGYGLLAALGVVLAHWGANLLDDYYDFRCQSVQKRQEMVDGGMRARSHKCQYLLDGQTSERTLLGVGLSFCLLASLIGLFFLSVRGTAILYFAGIGAFLSFFYSAPPFRLSFHGLGEITVGVLFGPVLMTGVAYCACGAWDGAVLNISIPLGLLVANILYTHSILDFSSDKNAGKKTLAVLLGTPYRAVWGSAILLLAIYAVVSWGVYRGDLPKIMLILFLSLPLAIGLWRLLYLHVTRPDLKVKRSFWMGPMEKWDLMEKAGLDWFMIRWFLSRNLLTFFCLLLFAAWLIHRFCPWIG